MRKKEKTAVEAVSVVKKVQQVLKTSQVKLYQIALEEAKPLEDQQNQDNFNKVLLLKIMINFNLKKIGQKIIIKRILLKKRFMKPEKIFQEEEGEEEEVIKTMTKEIIRNGILLNEHKIKMITKINIKTKGNKVSRVNLGKEMITEEIKGSKVLIQIKEMVGTNSTIKKIQRDMKIIITTDSNKAKQRMTISKVTIILEKLAITLTMMKILIIEQALNLYDFLTEINLTIFN